MIQVNPIKAIIAAAVIGIVTSGWLGWRTVRNGYIEQGRAEVRAKWDAANARAKAEQDAREQANRAAAAEAAQRIEADKAAIQAELHNKKKELSHATANLRACHISSDALRVLNAAAKRASEPAR